MSFFDQNLQSRNDSLFKNEAGISLYLKREDLLSTQVSGNKFRKLKYNIAFAKANHYQGLLTYGGAFSNHIAATARAGNLYGLRTLGIIRGEELGVDLNKTLQQNATLNYAYAQGMRFQFVSRSAYREKHTKFFRESVLKEYPDYYEIPEGGTNALAVKGCREILTEADSQFDYICCPAGTGGTAAGIIEASKKHQKVLVFPALKGDFLREEIAKYTQHKNWELITDYHFGGYAKINSYLVSYINDFKTTHNIQLDPIYTAKMMYGLEEMLQNGYFSKNTRILAVHTGGLQGISGMNARLKKKGIHPIIA